MCIRDSFRPNPIALSCVKLAGIRQTAEGPVLRVRGADLVNGTPILLSLIHIFLQTNVLRSTHHSTGIQIFSLCVE